MRGSLATQLRLGFAMAFLLVLGVCGMAWWIASDFERSAQEEQRNFAAVIALADAESALWQLRYGFPQFMIGDAAARKSILDDEQKLYAIVDSNFGRYEQTVHSAGEREAFSRLRAEYLRYKEARPKFFELYNAGRIDEAAAWGALATTPFGASAVKAFERQIELVRVHVTEDIRQDNEEVARARIAVVTMSVMLLALFALGYRIALRALQPIRTLRAQVDRMVREQLGEPIDVPAGSSEVTALEESFQLMSERLLAHTESLRESSARLDFLLHAAPVIIYSAQTRDDYAVSFMSANVRAQLGYAPEEFLRDPGFWPSHIHPDDRERVFAELAKIENMGSHALEYRYRDKNGSWRWMHDEFTLVRDSAGAPQELVGYWIDVTARTEAEAAHARLAAIVENATDAILSRARDGTILSWNAAAERLYGYTAAEVVGRDVRLAPPELRHDLKQNWDLVMQGNKVRSRETVRITKDGRRIHVSQNIFPLKNDAGGLIGMAIMSHDISARKRAEAMQVEALRAKTEFMKNVTHELRTPLNSVIGFAGLLKDEVPGPLNAKQAEFTTDILASGQRLLALVEGILEMSRLDATGAGLERESVEIGLAIEERAAAHRKAAEARSVTMRLEVAPDTNSVELDRKALRRMLDALIDNAIKFNREGGAVTVSAQRNDGGLEIAVADTGIGIAHENLAKLFKPLVQLDAGLARKHGGIGLGLALARRLAELHGGTLEVASEPGRGSTFTLRLPMGEC